MKGLYRKDLLIIWQSRWLLLLISVLVCSILVYFNQSASIISYASIFLTMQGVTSILTDRTTGWNLYETTFPISRAAAVRQKYFLSIALGLLGFAAGLLVSVLIDRSMDSHSLLINIGFSAILVFSVIALAVPLGILMAKSQYFIVLLSSFVLPVVLIALWTKGITHTLPVNPGEAVEIVYHFDRLAWMAGGCALLCLFSCLFCPAFLARQDQR